MREQLRGLLDRAVITTGTVAKFRRNPVTGRYDVMLIGVTVTLFDPEVPHGEALAVEVDHLWMQEGETAPIGTAIEALGTVHLYARADGSIDVGVRHRPSMNLPALRGLLINAMEEPGSNVCTRASLARQALDSAIEAQGRGCLVETGSNGLSTTASLEQLRRLTVRLERDAEANLTRLASGWLRSSTTRRERRAAERQAKRQPQPTPFIGAMA